MEYKAFDDIRYAVNHDTLLAYPDLNKSFNIHMDASDCHLGTLLIQGDQPIAFYNHNMKRPQMRYTVMENELLSIVETLNEFCTIL